MDLSETTEVEHAINMAQTRVNELKASFPNVDSDLLQGAIHNQQQRMFELDRDEFSGDPRRIAEAIIIQGANITAKRAQDILLELSV